MHQWLLFIYLEVFWFFPPTSLANKKKFQVNQFDDTGCNRPIFSKFAVTVPRRWGHLQRPPPRPRAKRPEKPKLPTAAGRAQGLRVGPGLGRRHARSLRGRGPAGRAGSRSVPLRARRPFVGRRSGFPAVSGPGVARSLHPAGACRSLNHLQCRDRRRARSCHREGPHRGRVVSAPAPPPAAEVGADSRAASHGARRRWDSAIPRRRVPAGVRRGLASPRVRPEAPSPAHVRPELRVPASCVPGSGRWVLLSPRAAGRRSAVTKGKHRSLR